LESCDGLNGVGATNGLHIGFGEAKVLHLALLDQFLHGSCDVFDGHFWIGAVLVEDVDAVDVQALQRCCGNLLDVLRAAVEALLSRGP
jgi:hypothetical protein